MKFNDKSLYIYIISIIFALSGCASMSQQLKKYPKGIADYTFTLQGNYYIPVTVVAKEYNMDWDWDPYVKTVTLYKQGHILRLLADSRLYYLDRKIEKLDKPVKLFSGFVAVPLSFVNIASSLKEKIPSGSFLIKKIVLDAGHGGKDTGAISSSTGLEEKFITLDIAKRLQTELQKAGLEVIMTRTDDTFIPLLERAHIANEKEADLFVSIHVNSTDTNSGAYGFEVFYLTDSIDDNSRALVSAENAVLKLDGVAPETIPESITPSLWDMVYTENRQESIDLARFISKYLGNALGIKERGIKGEKFAVLLNASMPAVLVEVGFISNILERKRLNNSFYRQMLAEMIGRGIMSYKTEFEFSEGYTD